MATESYAVEYAYRQLSWTLLFTARVRDILELVNIAFLGGLISLFGISANLINLIVFYQQGLNTVTNISFFALAAADLGTLLFQEAWAIFVAVTFGNVQQSIDYASINFMTIAIPRGGSARNACMITALITAERCLCIVFPQQINQIIRPNGAILVICLLFTGTLLAGIPIVVNSSAGWKFYKEINMTIFSIHITDSSHAVQEFIFITYAIFFILPVIAVVVFTSVLVFKLKKASAWRASAHIQQKGSLTKRDTSAMKVVVLVAIILVACYTPTVILSLVTFCEPEFSAHGRYAELYWGLWSFAVLFETINSSVNIFLYLEMSTRYRRTFHALFIRQKKCYLAS